MMQTIKTLYAATSTGKNEPLSIIGVFRGWKAAEAELKRWQAAKNGCRYWIEEDES
jgi:hypothetical protein